MEGNLNAPMGVLRNRSEQIADHGIVVNQDVGGRPMGNAGRLQHEMPLVGAPLSFILTTILMAMLSTPSIWLVVSLFAAILPDRLYVSPDLLRSPSTTARFTSGIEPQ